MKKEVCFLIIDNFMIEKKRSIFTELSKCSKLRGDPDKKLEFGHSDRLKNFHCVRMIRKATAI